MSEVILGDCETSLKILDVTSIQSLFAVLDQCVTNPSQFLNKPKCLGVALHRALHASQLWTSEAHQNLLEWEHCAVNPRAALQDFMWLACVLLVPKAYWPC